MTVGESAGRFTIVPPASDVRCHQAQRSRMEAHGTNCKHGLDRDAVVRRLLPFLIHICSAFTFPQSLLQLNINGKDCSEKYLICSQ